jgi:hypothetical protein
LTLPAHCRQSPRSPTSPKKKSSFAEQKSERTRRPYKLGVQHFMQTLRIQTTMNCARWTTAP